MRTTLNIEDDIYEAAKALADSEQRGLGEVLSRLARRGLQPTRKSSARARGGFPVVALPSGSPPVTSAAVRRALDED
jgi:hypothetical protein